MKTIKLTQEQYDKVIALINSDIERTEEYALAEEEDGDIEGLGREMREACADLTLLKVAITSQEE